MDNFIFAKINTRSAFRHFVLLTFILLLNACSTIKHDGPPNFYVDETKVHDAVPKVEHASKYGNRASYTVKGKQYHVMKNSKHYEAVGVASWYGTRFHSLLTSSGERYNMLAMTAAHKTLPLPTYVQVTNLKNGKKVIVKVNDRGPFEGNRLIDLSYVAAKKLGMLGHGTAMVDVKAINPMQNDKNNIAPKTILVKNNFYDNAKASLLKTPHLFLQVGTFRNRSNAEHLKSRLLAVTSTPVRVNQLAHKDKLYQVQIGPIKDLATAANISKRLHAVGLHHSHLVQNHTEV
jgi:rare lipoprotein A